MACASKKSGKGRPSCTICLRCRNSAARASAGRPAKTLEVAQELYDGQGKKIITYPRAEVRYLPESLITDVPKIVAGLQVGKSFSTIPVPDPPVIRKGASGSFYDKGLEGASHHAVIPNVNTVDDLREVWPRLSIDEKKLFDVIARAYLAAVMPDFRYRQTTATLDVRGFAFRAAGRQPIELGWRTAFPDWQPADEQGDDAQLLPALRNGETRGAGQPEHRGQRDAAPAALHRGHSHRGHAERLALRRRSARRSASPRSGFLHCIAAGAASPCPQWWGFPASRSRRCAVLAAIALHRLFHRRAANQGMLRASQVRWVADQWRGKRIPDVERCGRLTVTEVGHDGGQIGPRDHVEQFLLVDRKTRPDLPQVVDRVDVGNDGVMAGALESLVMETAACALPDNRGIGHRDRAERLTRLQAGHDLRNIRYQALREIAHLGAGIGDDLLSLAIIEFLSDFQRLAGRPAEARAAQFLQRGQIVELWRPLPLVFDAHAKRALEVPGRFDDLLGNLAPDNSLLRRVPHLELTAGHIRGGDNFKIRLRHEIPDFELALADDCQRWRLDPANSDNTPAPLDPE